jgi:hypothetical protein
MRHISKEVSEQDSDEQGASDTPGLQDMASDTEEEEVPRARRMKPSKSSPFPFTILTSFKGDDSFPDTAAPLMDDTADFAMEVGEDTEEQEQEGDVVYIDCDPVAPLDPTKVYVHRHPHSQFYARTPSSISPSQSDSPPKAPYWPYKTREDFEFAELCLDAGLPTGTIERLIKLTNKIKENPGCFTLKNAKQVMETADKATLFNEATVGVPTLIPSSLICAVFGTHGEDGVQRDYIRTHALLSGPRLCYSRDSC